MLRDFALLLANAIVDAGIRVRINNAGGSEYNGKMYNRVYNIMILDSCRLITVYDDFVVCSFHDYFSHDDDVARNVVIGFADADIDTIVRLLKASLESI